MRVLHISSGNVYGGVETFLLTLARHAGVCPEMNSHFAMCFEGRISAALRATGAPLHPLPEVRIRNPYTIAKARRRLRELVAAERFDVAICHSAWSHAIFGPTVRQAGIPLVFWLHDMPKGRHWLERWARRVPPDLAICNSQCTARNLPLLYPHTRFEVAYCPVQLPDSVDGQQDRERARRDLGVPREATVVIQACRMEAWKGHRLHLEALTRLRPDLNWMCWFAGGAQRAREISYVNELHRLVQSSGLGERVRFLGQRLDVAWLLGSADVHCQPNLEPEPFGLTFVEALQAGLPVVTTAIGGAKEIVDESCGILVGENNPVALADALGRLIEQPALRRRMGEAGRRRGLEVFGPRTQMPRISSLLHSVVNA